MSYETKFRAWNPKGKGFLYYSADDKWGASLKFENEEEFTSFQDKLNKDIYVGDIVSTNFNEYDQNIKGQVVFEKGAFLILFHYIPHDEERSKNFSYLLSHLNEKCRVIGHIHEEVK